MSADSRVKDPLDILQSMVNEILIETGKALRAHSKEGGKDYGSINGRLQKNIPRTIENFHQALDDLECDIFKAKAVFARDLEGLQEKQRALENPPQTIVEAHPSLQNSEQSNWAMDTSEAIQETTVSPSKPLDRNTEANTGSSIPQPSAPALRQPAALSAPIIIPSAKAKDQGLTPPSLVPKPIGLGISTQPATTEAAPAPTLQHDSSLDDLFDAGGSDLVNFDGLEFMDHSNDQSQPQDDDFDMANFGTAQDFNMVDLSNPTQTSNANTEAIHKQDDDMFSMANTQTADNMDFDFDLGGDDMDFAGTEMNHDLDSSFFES